LILYINGDSHSAGAEAVNSYCFAEDDPLYYGLGRQPHPDNERVSYGCELANMLYTVLHCDAESASSNSRIIRTTLEYLKQHTPELIVIGWSTWEREEWWDEGTQRYWQVNAGGMGHDWPNNIKTRYQEWVVSKDYQAAVEQNHLEIFAFHKALQASGLKHLFFTCYEAFRDVSEFDWSGSYIQPYDTNHTYYNWLKDRGFKTVRPDSYHFGPDAHRAWAEFLYQNYVQNILTNLE
jgi:hypothetical protein